MVTLKRKSGHTPKASTSGLEGQTEEKNIHTTPTDDTPPLYTPSNGASPSFPSELPTSVLRRANMLYITQKKSDIRGTFIIDPTLVIPKSVLPTLSKGEERKNISLRTNDGTIYVDIRVEPTPRAARPLGPRTSIDVTSQNGQVIAKFERPEGNPVSLSTHARSGKTIVYLPRSFEGPVNVFSRESKVILSPALIPSTTVFSESTRLKNWFIGDPARSGWISDPDRWLGDELRIETRSGKVTIMYLDEEDVQPEGSRKLFKDKLGPGAQWGIGFGGRT